MSSEADRAAFEQAWADYQTASWNAADMYEALPQSGRGGRIDRCPCGTVALGLCRVCRGGRAG